MLARRTAVPAGSLIPGCHIERIALDLRPGGDETVFFSVQNDRGKFMAQKQGHSLIKAVSAGLKEHNAVPEPDLRGEAPAEKIVHRAE